MSLHGMVSALNARINAFQVRHSRAILKATSLLMFAMSPIMMYTAFAGPDFLYERYMRSDRFAGVVSTEFNTTDPRIESYMTSLVLSRLLKDGIGMDIYEDGEDRQNRRQYDLKTVRESIAAKTYRNGLSEQISALKEKAVDEEGRQLLASLDGYVEKLDKGLKDLEATKNGAISKESLTWLSDVGFEAVSDQLILGTRESVAGRLTAVIVALQGLLLYLLSCVYDSTKTALHRAQRKLDEETPVTAV